MPLPNRITILACSALLTACAGPTPRATPERAIVNSPVFELDADLAREPAPAPIARIEGGLRAPANLINLRF